MSDTKKEVKKESKKEKKSSLYASFFDKRSTQYGSNMVLMVIAVLGVLILVNYIAGKELPRTDVTKNQQYTLSDQSKKILSGIEDEIKVVAFYQGDSSLRSTLEDLVTEYQSVNENITLDFVDPDREPAKARLYNVIQYNTIILEKGEKRETVLTATESDLTSGILKITRDERKKVYFIEGHGEKDIEGTEENTAYRLVKQELEKQVYDVAKTSLVAEGGIPEDADVVVLAGPRVAISDQEKDVLRSYINDRNGRILMLLDPLLDLGTDVNAETGVGLTEFLAEFGIEYGDGLVVDRQANYFGDASSLVVVDYATQQITQGLDRVLLPVVAKVGQAENIPENWQVTELMNSTIDSWLENNKTATVADFSEGEDEQGPISLAVAAQEIDPVADKEAEEGAEAEEKARMVVIGDSDFAVDPFVNPNLGVFNVELLVNSVNWLAAEEDLIAILPKEPQRAEVALTGSQSQVIFYSTVIGMPLVVGLVGVVLIVRRKRKRKR